MECKESISGAIAKIRRELIETLWNVKATRSLSCAVAARINRNIMECKECNISATSGIDIELIETLWNVKYPSLHSSQLQ